MPLRQIRKTYRKSELAILAWRSHELSINMRSSHPEPPRRGARSSPASAPEEFYGASDPGFRRDMALLEERLGPIADKLENEEGELDLRRLTGDEAVRYMNAIGIPIMPGFSRATI
jgi:hypothetical protein